MMKKALLISFVLLFFISSVVQATVINASGRQVRGVQGQNNKLFAAPFTLQKEGTLTAIVNDAGCYGFFIIIADAKGTIIYSTYSSTAAIGRKFGPGTFLIYPYLRDDANDATITVQFTY